MEDAAYARLIRKYYATERPIPSDLKAAQRLVGARTREEKAAVQSVLEEFFELTADGWRHRRCDREIGRFQEKRTKAQRSANARWAAQPSQSDRNANASGDDVADAMRPHCEGNAHHTPDPTHQTPDSKPNTEDTRSASSEAVEASDSAVARVTMEGAVCNAMRAEGMGSCNPGHPKLTELLKAGAEVQNFVSAARSAIGKHKGFAYALGIVEGQLAEARALATAGRTSAPISRNGHSGSAARAARMAEAVPNLVANGHAPDEFIDTETRDVTPRRLG